MNPLIYKMLLAKLALATSMLLNMQAQIAKMEPRLGATITPDYVTTVESFENDYLTKNGKYSRVQKTQNGSITYYVNEMAYPDGSKGYQLISETTELISMASGTTPVITSVTSKGYGKDAKNLTWQK